MSKDYKTIHCNCGKEIIFVEGNIITDLCSLCPQKMSSFYISIRNTKQYIEVIARTKEDATATFMKEYSSLFDMLRTSDQLFKNRGYEKVNKMVHKYSGKELEDKYPPGDSRRKKTPRSRRKK